MKNRNLTYLIIGLSLIYLFVDAFYFFGERESLVNSTLLSHPHEPSKYIYFRWGYLLITIVVLVSSLKHKIVLQTAILLLSILILLLGVYNFFKGNIYRGSFISSFPFIEIIALLNVLLYIFRRKKS